MKRLSRPSCRLTYGRHFTHNVVSCPAVRPDSEDSPVKTDVLLTKSVSVAVNIEQCQERTVLWSSEVSTSTLFTKSVVDQLWKVLKQLSKVLNTSNMLCLS